MNKKPLRESRANPDRMPKNKRPGVPLKGGKGKKNRVTIRLYDDDKEKIITQHGSVQIWADKMIETLTSTNKTS